jgi:hypothetical protein
MNEPTFKIYAILPDPDTIRSSPQNIEDKDRIR